MVTLRLGIGTPVSRGSMIRGASWARLAPLALAGVFASSVLWGSPAVGTTVSVGVDASAGSLGSEPAPRPRGEIRNPRMRGQALVAGVPLLGADVTLLRGGPKSGTSSVVARGRTNATGRFALYYPAPAATDLLFLVTTGGSLVPAGGQAPRSGRATPAVRGDLVRRANMARPVPAAFQLSSAIGRKRPWSVVVNDLTTGAAGFALAQFVGGGTLAGASPGFDNAAAMAANRVDFRTGGISPRMRRAPNGAIPIAFCLFRARLVRLPG